MKTKLQTKKRCAADFKFNDYKRDYTLTFNCDRESGHVGAHLESRLGFEFTWRGIYNSAKVES